MSRHLQSARAVLWSALACLALTPTLAACSTDDGACDPNADGCGVDGLPTLRREELLDPETCKDCHPQHYREWKSSMHAYAATDPVFLAMNRLGQEQTRGALGDFCVQCHAPMAVREGVTTDGLNLDEVRDHLEGVTCYFCHNTVDVEDDHNNPLRLAGDTTLRAGIADAARPSAHATAYSRLHDGNLHRSTELCGSCHDITTPAGVHLERTFAEWRESVFSADTTPEGFLSCGNCHMGSYPGVAADDPAVRVAQRDVHEHLFAGVDVALTAWPGRDMQQKAVECELASAIRAILTPDPGGVFRLYLEAQSGHRTPSGASQDRRVWVELIAYDADDEVLFSTGAIAGDEVEEKPEGDPDHDPNLWLMRDWLYDETGKATHRFWEAATTDAHPKGYEAFTLPATEEFGQRHGLDRAYNLTVYVASGALARVTVRVRVRPMGLDVLDELIESGHLDASVRDTMPTHTFAGSQLEWRVEDGYAEVKTPVDYPDCPLPGELGAAQDD